MEHSERTLLYINQIKSNLIEELGEIPVSYEVSLDLLADSLDLYFKAVQDIKEKGIVVKDTRSDGYVKNPSVSVLNSTQIFIHKMLSSFGLTRLAHSKLKENAEGMTATELYDALTK